MDVTRKKGVEGGLFQVVLGTPESFMDLTDGDPYLQVQLIGKGFGRVPLMKPIVSDTVYLVVYSKLILRKQCI